MAWTENGFTDESLYEHPEETDDSKENEDA
jgi:hypothetical protein